MSTLKERKTRHISFWNREKVDRPLVGFQIGTYMFADRFKAAENIMKPGKMLSVADIDVDAFMGDYERMYQESEKTGQDAFWTASPFISIPWMEAILGCKIRIAESSMTSEPWLDDIDDFNQVVFRETENEWFEKFIEFINKLSKLAAGRFPVGQPILRGPSDMMGALMGQKNLVYDICDNPEAIKKLGHRVTNIYLQVIHKMQSYIDEFNGGYAMGFYHLWAPGKCIWMQEDLSSLMSPGLYRRYIKDFDKKILSDRPYNLFHIHPASFYILDELMTMAELKVIQVNKDIGGPTIAEMYPQFTKVLSQKRLVIWGTLTYEDLDFIMENLSYQGLYLHIVTETVAEAKKMMNYIKEKS